MKRSRFCLLLSAVTVIVVGIAIVLLIGFGIAMWFLSLLSVLS